MKVVCPHCGRKFVNQEWLDKHLAQYPKEVTIQSDKRKGWVTPHGFMDFSHPVTCEEACKMAEQFAKEFHNGR